MFSCLQGSGGCGGCVAKRRSSSPCEGGGGKVARWEDSIARLEAVAAGAGGAEWSHDDERRCRRRWCGAHDTIRAENGKCYLELGGAAHARCASRRCYRERRLKVMNLCALKLTRLRQTPDPSLSRSVLVCNTLRCIEREVERESAEEAPESMAAVAAVSRFEPPASRAPTPFPTAAPPDRDSGYGDSERSIDWGSVLSLSSRSALDPAEDAWPDDWGWSEEGFARLPVPTS